MIPGLDGEIHGETERALLASMTGGLLAGYTLAESHPVVFLAIGLVAAVLPLWLVPDAETVTSDWIDYQREEQSEGSEA